MWPYLQIVASAGVVIAEGGVEHEEDEGGGPAQLPVGHAHQHRLPRNRSLAVSYSTLSQALPIL
jgi:hypothetical protein